MSEDKKENKYLKHIQDLTYFYIKKRYKKHCKKNNIDFIKREDLYNLVEKLFVDEKKKYKKYIFEKLEEDFGEIDEGEVNQIFVDMQDDSEMICKRITEIIDEHQEKKGYY
jgi:hypothetical protein